MTPGVAINPYWHWFHGPEALNTPLETSWYWRIMALPKRKGKWIAYMPYGPNNHEREGLKGKALQEVFDEYSFALAPMPEVWTKLNLWHGRVKVWFSAKRESFIFQDCLNQVFELPLRASADIPALIRGESLEPGFIARELGGDEGRTATKLQSALRNHEQRIKDKAEQQANAHLRAAEINAKNAERERERLAKLDEITNILPPGLEI